MSTCVLRWSALLATLVCSCADAAAVLRGHRQPVPGMAPKVVGGINFDDSPAAVNIWAGQTPYGALNSLMPTAPMDRIDVVHAINPSGAVPLEPGDLSEFEPTSGDSMPTDIVAPYQHPHTFPWEKTVPEVAEPINIPIGQRTMVAYADRIRPYGRFVDAPMANYPLVAPANRIVPGPYAVSPADTVPPEYARFFDQVHDLNAKLTSANSVDKEFVNTDADKDGSISSEEFDAEVKGRQGKTDDQAMHLWDLFHSGDSQDMSQQEFKELAQNGFDLNQEYINRSDLTAVLAAPHMANLGYWGAGTACPDGAYVSGVQLKVMPISDSADNTALNAIKLKCTDGTELPTAEGPNGTWTDYAECPNGEQIYAWRARNQVYDVAVDNSGINDMMFECRSKDLSTYHELRFGDSTSGIITTAMSNVVVGNGKVANEGGWSGLMDCGAQAYACGAQVRLLTGSGQDDMGITDVRVFCCSAPLDCSDVCTGEASGTLTPECATCQEKNDPSNGVDVASQR